MTDADGNVKDDKAEEKNQNDSKTKSDKEINAAAITSPKKKSTNIKERFINLSQSIISMVWRRSKFV